MNVEVWIYSFAALCNNMTLVLLMLPNHFAFNVHVLQVQPWRNEEDGSKNCAKPCTGRVGQMSRCAALFLCIDISSWRKFKHKHWNETWHFDRHQLCPAVCFDECVLSEEERWPYILPDQICKLWQKNSAPLEFHWGDQIPWKNSKISFERDDSEANLSFDLRRRLWSGSEAGGGTKCLEGGEGLAI